MKAFLDRVRGPAGDALRRGGTRLAAGLSRPSAPAQRRAAGALVLATAAGAAAAWRAHGVAGWCVALTGAGGLLMAVGLAWRLPRVVAGGVVVVALAVALGAVTGRGPDAYGAAEGAALLAAAELSWWSLEAWIPMAAERGVDRPRWVLLIGLSVSGLGLGLAASAAAGTRDLTAAGVSGAVVEALGAAGAVLVAGLVAVVRRLD